MSQNWEPNYSSRTQPQNEYQQPLPESMLAPQPEQAPATAPAHSKGPGWIAVLSLLLATAVLTSLFTLGVGLSTGYLLLSNNSNQSSTSAEVETADGSTRKVETTGEAAPDSWVATAGVASQSTVAIQVTTPDAEGSGSGIIYSASGQVLTNSHVVNGATEVYVTLNDGRSFAADIVGEDISTDLAVVQIRNVPDGLVPAEFADSDQLVVGQDVMAVGNPLGLANTATTGIISALNRPVVTGGITSEDASFTSAIQTDASINPGNSGGSLVNREGKVIGVNSSIASNASSQANAGSIGLGFAIPSNTAVLIADQLIENGSVEHALLGVRAQDAVLTQGDMQSRGAQVIEVVPGSPAEAAGIQIDDLVLKVDEVKIDSAAGLTAYIRSLPVGSSHEITLIRNGQELTLSFQL